MKKNQQDLLFEIQTEELPPKALLKLAQAFANQVETRLKKLELNFNQIEYFATPRRLALYITQLDETTADQTIERKGPALSAAFDAQGQPSKALIGFAKSCGVEPSQLSTIKNAQGEWMTYTQVVKGKDIAQLIPEVIEEALFSLPIPKRMRWGNSEVQFVRPLHSIILLYGNEVIKAKILGLESNRTTLGHRFHSNELLIINHPSDYLNVLQQKGFVLANFEKRREEVIQKAKEALKNKIGNKAQIFISSEALLNEVTALVEWPVALCGQFDGIFLKLPKEVLISSMQDHQRYFPVVDERQELLPYFITISNIEGKDPQHIVAGNERVLRARLSDAAFFYSADQKEKLDSRLERLKGIIFQAKLGTLYDKSLRLSKLSEWIAHKIKADEKAANRAGLISKTDLTTNMVGEFPELQGVMGYYYAKAEGEIESVATAIKEQYLPRFANDQLAKHPTGICLAIADRMDLLVGYFGINQLPTGDKDPFGLRRAALGILRTLIENQIHLDLNEIISYATGNYQVTFDNKEILSQLLNFFQERLRAFYLEKGITADIFEAVSSLKIHNPIDIHARIKAVEAFKKLNAAETLSVANKRVNNILTKYEEPIKAQHINPQYFESAAEKELAIQLDAKSEIVNHLSQSGKYNEILLELSELKKPVDDFFDQVMVMTEDKMKRENRILLLSKLRTLFLKVADIALLQ